MPGFVLVRESAQCIIHRTRATETFDHTSRSQSFTRVRAHLAGGAMKYPSMWLLLGCISLLAPLANADDWPMFGRDASRNAVSPEKNPPLDWQMEKREGGQLTTPARNIKWKADLGKMTVGSPI